MPYITTIKKDVPKPGSAWLAGVTDEEWAERNASRRAVATLEEARARFASGIFDDDDDRIALLGQFDLLSDSGGTVGPLPDGTIITVEWEAS